jgi:hypothetical protein
MYEEKRKATGTERKHLNARSGAFSDGNVSPASTMKGGDAFECPKATKPRTSMRDKVMSTDVHISHKEGTYATTMDSLGRVRRSWHERRRGDSTEPTLQPA